MPAISLSASRAWRTVARAASASERSPVTASKLNLHNGGTCYNWRDVCGRGEEGEGIQYSLHGIKRRIYLKLEQIEFGAFTACRRDAAPALGKIAYRISDAEYRAMRCCSVLDASANQLNQ